MPVYRTDWKHYEWKKKLILSAYEDIYVFIFYRFLKPLHMFLIGLDLFILWGYFEEHVYIKSSKNDEDLERVTKVEFPQIQQSLIFTSVWVILLGVVISVADGL